MKFTAISKLKSGMRIGQDLIGISCAEKYTMGYCLSEDDITFLSEIGVSGVYTMEALPLEIINPNLMHQCISALKSADLNAILPLAEQLAKELITRQICLDFKSIRSYDDYLFHHSICVAVYAVSIGIQMNMTTGQLYELALSGLLHDIGLIISDQSLLIKGGALTSEEYAEIKKHPLKSYEFIKTNPLIPVSVQNAVLHHHENFNGTGYPEKLADEKISPYARILHIADVYDALLSKRPYKKGMSNTDAMSYLIGGKMILFDEQIVVKFLEIIVPYPTGTEIRLSNNEIAQVIGQTSDSNRPLVYLTSKQKVPKLPPWQLPKNQT